MLLSGGYFRESRDRYCRNVTEKVSRLDPIKGGDVGRTVRVDGEILSRPAEDSKGAFERLLKGPLDSIDSDKHMGSFRDPD